MPAPSSNEPKIVHCNITIIEVFEVSNYELRRMEEDASSVGTEFATTLAAISITISLGISLTQGELEADTEIAFKAAIGVAELTSVYMRIKWFRRRSTFQS